ncbi:hypothetical protein [Siphonobacter sp. SORGH_AS_0500]|uniref:hypothetical protein n=1 Tax=Siphonobacter sp. SORGH_AS_0500 TaxID=1864824 RepID=UPI002865E510|nr:hypothetical protein [Siphonobacter sp. SORGH_AS_0500]MDR6195647.1 hypothetical protein [Siphonobacter sp. SORGH_AS_0500]
MKRIGNKDKLQKYRQYYTGDYQLSEEEEDYLARYEDIQDKLSDDDYTRSDIVKYVMRRYGVSKQMANRTVNEASDLYGDMVEVHKKASRAFQIEKLQRAANLCLNPPASVTLDHDDDGEGGRAVIEFEPNMNAYERIMNQINKLQGLYTEDPDQVDDPEAYEVTTNFHYEAVEDIAYEDVTPKQQENQSQQGTIGLPESTSEE